MSNYTLSIRHIDTCLSDFVIDHCNGESEKLYGVAIDGKTRMHEVRNGLYQEFTNDFSDKIPQEISLSDFMNAINETFAGTNNFTKFDSSLENNSEDSEITVYAWFKITWEKIEN